jgi:hypothetical protein
MTLSHHLPGLVPGLAAGLAATALASHAAAQGPAFQTPGQPRGVPTSGQTDRFSTEFNPAISFVVDALGSWLDLDDADEDGFDLELRSLELTGAAYVDPKAWAYFVAVAEDEALSVEEGALNFVGLPGRSTFRAGRFFVDFGKQMQIHVHDLLTVDRPLVLREYLGAELGGDGVQWDHWTPVGEGALRWSLGVFGSLLAEHDEEEEDDGGPEQVAPDLKDVDELHYTARLTGFTDVGANGVLQLGASARAIPEFAFTLDDSGATADGLSNQVYGLDVTYGWTDDQGLRNWTLGGEFLLNGGDNGAAVDDQGTPGNPGDDTLSVLDDSVSGYYAFVDYGWNPYNSVGVQYSQAELADGADSDVQELDLYYTRHFSEFHRLRFAVTTADSDVDGDALRFAVQYTGFIGAHAHGLNW